MWSLFRSKKAPVAPIQQTPKWPSTTPSPTWTNDVETKNFGEAEGETPSFSPITLRLTALPDSGRISVVGESHYQRALRHVTQGKIAGDDFDHHIPVTALLIPEPRNKWDRNAVRVDVLAGNQSVKVGYLPGDLAKEYQPELMKLVQEGLLGTCAARVAGGGAKYYGIYLHLAWPRELRIANGSEDPVIAKRTAHDVLLRNDYSCTVTGEGDHQEVLRGYAPKRGQGFKDVVANLTFCEIKTGKYKGEDAIEVRLNGQRVGQLTYAMTKRYGGIVRSLLDSNLRVDCEAFTVNTAKGVQLELRMPTDPERQQR